MPKLNIRFRLCILMTSSLCLTAYSQDAAKSLDKLNAQIETVKSNIQHQSLTKQKTEVELGLIETQTADLEKKLEITKKFLNNTKLKLDILNQKINDQNNQISKQKNTLKALLVHAYKLNQQPALAMLLKGDNIDDSERLITYYHYFTNKENEIIASIQALIESLKSKKAALNHEKSELAGLIAKEHEQLNQIHSRQHKREQLIAHLTKELSKGNNLLTSLEENQHELTATLNKLPHETVEHGHFGALKGHLAWPTSGKVTHHFGDSISHSELKWDGILIKAPENAPVFAVADGKVVFSRWMPGYGLLLIISHGNGYMTLYSRNHYLYKQAGESVEAGTLIARVGKSGGYHHPGLYFAVRKNAQPEDPLKWLH